jgi:hypothetical protein
MSHEIESPLKSSHFIMEETGKRENLQKKCDLREEI